MPSDLPTDLNIISETFEPILIARYDEEKGSRKQHSLRTMMAEFRTRYAHSFVSKTLTRPIRMLWEPLVFFVDLFLLYQYTVYFLYFEAYPFIFKGTYKMSAGLAAAMQLPSKSPPPTSPCPLSPSQFVN